MKIIATLLSLRVYDSFRLVALAVVIVTASGCAVYKFDESSIKASAMPQQQTVPFQISGREARKRLNPESDSLPRVRLKRSVRPSGNHLAGISVLGFASLGIIPMKSWTMYFDETSLVWEDQVLASNTVRYVVNEYMSLLPIVLLIPGTANDDNAARAKGRKLALQNHFSHYAKELNSQGKAYRTVNEDDPESLGDFLKTNSSSPLFRPKATQILASLAPEDNTLAYHHKYQDLPGYMAQVPRRQQALLIGPEGLKGWQIQEALEQGTPEESIIEQMVAQYRSSTTAARNFYKGMTNGHRKILANAGLPLTIVELMSNRQPPAELVAALEAGNLKDRSGKTLSKDELMEKLVRKDNAGKFMSPYTSDGVLAEWVNSAINADIGATVGAGVGAAAGAYAANKALDSVPFGLGSVAAGIAGSAVGEKVGREAAIAASGGWSAIRDTSDRSFDSLASMARYLEKKYGKTRNYRDAMAATAQIYPELQDYL